MDDSSATVEDGLIEDSEGRSPKDSFWIVKIIMVLLGMGVLLPWNMVTSAGEYFNTEFGEDRHPMFLIPLLYNLPAVPTMIVMIASGGKFGCMFSTRLLVTFFLDACILVAIPLIPVVMPEIEAACVFFISIWNMTKDFTILMMIIVFVRSALRVIYMTAYFTILM